MKKKLLIFIFAFFVISQMFGLNKTEAIRFRNDRNSTFSGKLIFPEKKMNKVIIVIDDDVYRFTNPEKRDTAFYDYKLMNELLKEDIGWFVFTPDSIDFLTGGNTNRESAGAAGFAVKTLKEKYKNIQVGTIGCSENGMSAALLASSCKEVDFLVSVTSIFMDGPKFLRYNLQSLDNPWADFRWKQYVIGFMIMGNDTFNFRGNIKTNDGDNLMNCVMETLDSINADVFKMKIIPDTQTYYQFSTVFKKKFKRFFSMKDFPNRNSNNPAMRNIDAEFFIDNVLPMYYGKRDYSMIQWNPSKVFSMIDQPVLALIGGEDKLIEPGLNKKCAEEIASTKKNMDVHFFSELGHAMKKELKQEKKEQQYINGKPMARNPVRKTTYTPDSVIKLISEWIFKQ